MDLLKDRSIRYSALAGLVYGLSCRLVFTFKWSGNIVGVMTIGFLMVMPMAFTREDRIAQLRAVAELAA